MESVDITQDRRTRSILIGIVIGAAILRLIKINESLSIDELLTIRDYVSHGFSAIFLSYLRPNNHILTSLLARVSILAFGPYNWAYKLPSFLLAVWAVILQFRLGRIWFDDDTALASSALLSGSYYHILFSTQTRGYSGMLTCTLLALVSYTLAWREDKNKSWLVLGVALVSGSYFHPFMIFPYLGCLFCGIYLYRNSWGAARKFIITFTGTALAISLLYLPLWGQIEEIYRYRTGYDFLSKRFLWFVAGYFSGGPTFTPATIAYGSVFFLGLWYLKSWPKRVGVVLFFVIPVVGLKYVIQPVWLFTRFFIFFLPIYLVVVSYGITSVLKRRFWIGVLALVLLNVPILTKFYRTKLLPSSDVIEYVADRAGPDEWVVANGFTRLMFYYYRGPKDRLRWFEPVEGKEANTFMGAHQNDGIWYIGARKHDKNSDPVFSFRPKWVAAEPMKVGDRDFYFKESFRGLHPLGKTLTVYYSPAP